MAVIGSIRKQSGLLIILVGAAMVLFILSDFVGSSSGAFTNTENVLGEIRDHEVTQRDFELAVEKEIQERYGAEGAPEAAKESIRQRIWQQLLQEHILFEEYDKLGISVSPNELLDQVQNTQPGSVLYQYFTDPQTGQVLEQFRDPSTGMLNSQAVLSAIQQLLGSEDAANWLPIEKAVKQDRMFSKYMTLLTKGLTATGTEANQIYDEKSAKRNIRYAVREYNSIPDEEIEISDSDLQSYYNEHKNEKRFKQGEEIRSVEYITFDVTPTEADIQDIYLEMSDLLPLFAADSNDTAFVAENADMPVQSAIRTLKEDELPVSLRDTMANSDTGAVFGPYDQGNSIVISKISSIVYTPDSVRARHILIQPTGNDTSAISSARAKLDSLKTVIEENDNFAEMAIQYSEDPGSGALGGDLDWFGRGRMVPRFEKACFEGEVGDLVVVLSQSGMHLIEITDQTEDIKRYIVSNVDRLKEASKSTTDAVYRTASSFSIENNTSDKFREKGADMNIQTAGAVRIADENIGTISGAREAVRWAYDNEKGAVSEPIEIGDRFLVVSLSNVRPKGILPLEAAKVEIKQDVMKQKKAERIISELGTYNSVADAAGKFGSQAIDANDVYFSSASMPGGMGREMAVMGTVFSLEQGKVSKPIEGNRGVFVIEVTGMTAAPAGVDIANEKTVNSSELENRAQRSLYQALQEEADIEDNRGRYY